MSFISHYNNKSRTHNQNVRRLIWAFLLLVFSVSLGITGYMTICQYSFTDAFYMTMITISTVGFGEVSTLETAGKIFTSLYIIMNLTILAYVVTVITSYFLEGELQQMFYNYISKRELKNLKNHIIICGYGRHAARVCEELADSNKEFVIIEQSADKIADAAEQVNHKFIHGDATLDETLITAGLDKAEAVISVLPKDADNLYVTLSVRELNKDIMIIARSTEKKSEKKLKRAGATKVVMPHKLGGSHMAHIITKPYVIEFLRILNGMEETDMHLEEIAYDSLKDEFKDKTIRELDIRSKTGANIVAFKDPQKGFLFNPASDVRILKDDILILLGNEQVLNTFKETFTLS